jgi:hypothetical protein
MRHCSNGQCPFSRIFTMIGPEIGPEIGPVWPAATMPCRNFASILVNGDESSWFRADLAVFDTPEGRPALAKPGPLWQGSARLEGPYGPILVIRGMLP